MRAKWAELWWWWRMIVPVYLQRNSWYVGGWRLSGCYGTKAKDISSQTMTIRFNHYIHILQLMGAISHELILQPFIFFIGCFVIFWSLWREGAHTKIDHGGDKIKSLQPHFSIMSASVFPTKMILMGVNSWLRIEWRAAGNWFGDEYAHDMCLSRSSCMADLDVTCLWRSFDLIAGPTMWSLSCSTAWVSHSMSVVSWLSWSFGSLASRSLVPPCRMEERLRNGQSDCVFCDVFLM